MRLISAFAFVCITALTACGGGGGTKCGADTCGSGEICCPSNCGGTEHSCYSGGQCPAAECDLGIHDLTSHD